MRCCPRSMILLGILSFFALGCGRDSTAATEKAPAPKMPKAIEVRVVPAAEVKMPRTVGVSGTLAADDLVVLSLKVPGRISELKVDIGTRVRKGQLVARLDPTDYRLRVDQAQATLVQARVRLGLSADGTDDRVDPEKTALVRQGRAVLEEARLTRERLAKLLEQQ